MRYASTSSLASAVSLLASLVSATGRAAAAEATIDPRVDGLVAGSGAPSTTAAGDAVPSLDRPLLGAASPGALDLVAHGSAGFAMILPHVTLAGRLGLGGGFSGELGYRNLALFGQEGRARLSWGARANASWDIGVALRSSVATLELGDGQVIGIPLSSVPLGNDWEIGNDLVATLRGPGTVSMTAQIGPTLTMGGLRPTGVETNEFRIEPALRSVNAVGIVEWGLGEATNVFLRFDAMFLLGIEADRECQAAHQEDCSQLVPIGFLPTASAGVAWAP